jgi:hypothetical protein
MIFLIQWSLSCASGRSTASFAVDFLPLIAELEINNGVVLGQSVENCAKRLHKRHGQQKTMVISRIATKKRRAGGLHIRGINGSGAKRSVRYKTRYPIQLD